MRFRDHIFFLLSLLLALSSVQSSVVFGQGDEAFPYVASITSRDVYARSGPGLLYYPCGKLNINAKVRVVGHVYSWSQILPSEGSFSWISSQYVSIGDRKSMVGTVTGNQVRVYAGSSRIKPEDSTQLQTKLNKGYRVEILDPNEVSGYYKIKSPKGAYLYVKTEFTQMVPEELIEETVERAVLPIETADHNTPKAQIKEVKPAVAVSSVQPQVGTKLDEYYQLEKKIKQEKLKSVAEQDYSSIKKALTEIASEKDLGKASRYSKFALKQVERYELALKVDSALKAQAKEMSDVEIRIEKYSQSRLASIKDLGRYAVVGVLESSSIFGKEPAGQLWRIVDSSGKIVCYCSSDSMGKAAIDGFVGKKVGLIGTIEPYVPTSGALVRFNSIETVD